MPAISLSQETGFKWSERLAVANVTVQDLVSGYSVLATVIEAELIEPVILIDPNNDEVLTCALSAEAELIVSGDSDLLDLKAHKEIRILTATEFLAELSL